MQSSELISARASNDSSSFAVRVWMRLLATAIFGAILGGAMGGLCWVSKPRLYKAVALIQVVSPDTQNDFGNSTNVSLPRNIGGIGGFGNASGDVGDDVVLIQSRQSLEEAIKIGKLSSYERLKHHSSDDLVAWLKDPSRLKVRPGTSESATRLIEVGFRCEDAELSVQIVAAIVAGYESYVVREATERSQDKLQVIDRVRDEYDRRLEHARAASSKLVRATSISATGDEREELVASVSGRTSLKIEELQHREQRYQALLSFLDEAENDESNDLEIAYATLVRIEPAIQHFAPQSVDVPLEDKAKERQSFLWKRFKEIAKSIRLEITHMRREGELLGKLVDEQQKKGLDQRDAIEGLKAIEQEMETMRARSSELQFQAENLGQFLRFYQKEIKRVELAKRGEMDRSDLRGYLTNSAWLGSIVCACFFVLAYAGRIVR